MRCQSRMGQVEIATRFGENLARCRHKAQLSQEQLAVRASLHRTEIGMLERGIRLPRIDTLIKLAGGLEISPGELLDGLDWEPGGPRLGQFRFRERCGPEPAPKSLRRG